MKNIMILLIVIALLCAFSKDDGPTLKQNDLLGTWHIVSYSQNQYNTNGIKLRYKALFTPNSKVTFTTGGNLIFDAHDIEGRPFVDSLDYHFKGDSVSLFTYYLCEAYGHYTFKIDMGMEKHTDSGILIRGRGNIYDNIFNHKYIGYAIDSIVLTRSQKTPHPVKRNDFHIDTGIIHESIEVN